MLALTPTPASLEEDDVKLCNCAGCSQELLGESMTALTDQHGLKALPPKYRKHSGVHQRYRGRPYCLACALIREVREDLE